MIFDNSDTLTEYFTKFELKAAMAGYRHLDNILIDLLKNQVWYDIRTELYRGGIPLPTGYKEMKQRLRNIDEKEPHGVRRADCAGKGSAQNGLMRHQHTLTHTHTQMQALNPTPKHLFRVFLSSLETKELELLKTWTSIKSLEVPRGANYRLSEVPLITEDSPNHKLSTGDLKQVKKELIKLWATW